MFTAQFGKKTTLAALMSDTETSSGTLSSAVFTDFTDDYLVIDYDIPAKTEVIKCSVTGTGISSITRAQEGTTAVEHAIGAKVGYNFVPSHYSALNKFWAALYMSGTSLVSQGSATVTVNPAYSATAIDPNTNGFKERGYYGIVGGLYFTAPRTGYYEISYQTTIRAYGANGPTAIYTKVTNDTSTPTQNNDSTNDGGTAVTELYATSTTYSSDYNDVVVHSKSFPVLLTAGTVYYISLQVRHSTSASTINIMEYPANQGACLEVKELDGN